MSHRLQTESDVGAAGRKGSPTLETLKPCAGLSSAWPERCTQTRLVAPARLALPSAQTLDQMGPGHMSEGILAQEGVTNSKQSWWQHLPLDQKMQEAGGMQE